MADPGVGQGQGLVPHTEGTSFTSFNAAAFFQQQQQDDEKRRADLQKAADKYLQSSSSESEEASARGASSSGTDSSSSSHQHRKRKRRSKDSKKSKKKRRKEGKDEQEKILRMELRAAALGKGSRKPLPGSKPWTSSLGLGSSSRDQLLYFDLKGDMQNIVYKGLYAMDKASFYRRDPLRIALHLSRPRHLGGQGDAEIESHVKGSRYFHPQHVMAERSKRVRRVHLTRPWTPPTGLPQISTVRSRNRFSLSLSRSMPLPAFISLNEQKASGTGAALPIGFGQGGQAPPSADQAIVLAQEEGETAEEWLLRRTKELNSAARDPRAQASAWLELADFQDEVARLLGGRGRRAQLDARAVAGKKVAILERAVSANPGNPHLLLALLRAAAPLLDPPTLSARWEAALRRWQSDLLLGSSSVAAAVQGVVGEAVLWQQYLRTRKTLFPTYSQADMQVVYNSGVSALCLGLARLEREGAGAHQLAAAEMEVVRLLLDSIQTSLQAGHNESAVARLQALLEFHACAPSGVAQHWAAGGGAGSGGQRYSLGASLRLWCAFWDSGVPRIGEVEAAGWAAWFRREHEDLLMGPAGGGDAAAEAQAAAEAAAAEAQGGSWSGWVVLELGVGGDTGGDAELGLVGPAGAGSGGGAAGEGEAGQEAAADQAGSEDGELLPEEEAAGAPQLTEEELLEQLGLRLEQELEGLKKAGVPPHIMSRWIQEEQQRSARRWAPSRPVAAEGGEEAGEVPDPEALVDTQELRSWLFPIQAAGVRDRLLLGCCALLGAPLGTSWTSSNQPLLLDATGPPANTLSVYMLNPSTHMPYLTLVPTHPQATASAAAYSPAAYLQPAVCPVPWYALHESRRQFLAGVLKTLVGTSGPLRDSPCACLAYLLVEATHAEEGGLQAGLGAQAGDWVKGMCSWGQVQRAREAAKQLLAVQRHNLALWGALASLEALTGDIKAARRVFDAALAGAQSVPGQVLSDQLPSLALQAALNELHGFAALQPATSVGGRGQWQSVRMWSAAEAKLRQRRALHYLLWLLTSGIASGSATSSSAFKAMKVSDAPPSPASIIAARQAVAGLLPSMTQRAATGELSAADGALLFASGLVEVLAGRCVAASGGSLPATLAVLRNVVSRVPRDVRQYSLQHEVLQERFCQLAVACTMWPDEESEVDISLVLPPTAVKTLLMEALDLYPHNQTLLHLMVTYEHHAHALTRLHQYLNAACQAHASAQLLALALTCEAGRVGSAALGGLRALLERAAVSEALGNNPELWLTFIRFEMCSGKLDAARRVFLRAVRQCPGCKQLWLTGFEAAGSSTAGADATVAAAAGARAASGRAAAGGLTPREVSELMGVMADKGCRVFTDVVEVVMAALDEEQQH